MQFMAGRMVPLLWDTLYVRADGRKGVAISRTLYNSSCDISGELAPYCSQESSNNKKQLIQIGTCSARMCSDE
jgi:hypothetical protein